jgi:hypothetical protein
VSNEHAATEQELFEGEFTAEINPNNQETKYFFEYSTEAEDGELKGSISTVGSGTTAGELFGPQLVNTRAREEPADATYYYRVVARNAAGTTYGNVQAYTKLPIVSDPSACGITLSFAILKAEVYPNFQQTRYGFEYSSSEAALEEGHGRKIFGASELAANEEEVPPTLVSLTVSGLEENMPYYYRAIAENGSSENPSSPNKGEPATSKIARFMTESPPFEQVIEAWLRDQHPPGG